MLLPTIVVTLCQGLLCFNHCRGVATTPRPWCRHGVDVLAVRLRVAVGLVVALWPGVLLTVQALRAFSGGFLGAGTVAVRPFLDVVGEELSF